MGEDTLRLAQVKVEARELDLITVAGKTEPVRIYELLSQFGSWTRLMTNCAKNSPAVLPPVGPVAGTKRGTGSRND
jgi:hypothetical protein